MTHDGVTNKFSLVHKGNKREEEKKEREKEKVKGEKIKEKKVKKNKNESLLVGRKPFKNVLLNKKKTLFFLPTDMCYVVNTSLANLPT
ncbi:hypothetical protein CR513_57567, partial [Mucuna pruriens]